MDDELDGRADLLADHITPAHHLPAFPKPNEAAVSVSHEEPNQSSYDDPDPEPYETAEREPHDETAEREPHNWAHHGAYSTIVKVIPSHGNEPGSHSNTFHLSNANT